MPRSLLEFMDVPTGAAWDMPPEEAIAFLRGKGLRTTFSWTDMVGEEHARSFTIAKMQDADLLATVHESLLDAQARGVPFQEWQDSIVPTLQAKGWWGRKEVLGPDGVPVVAQLGSPSRLQTIYRTNMQSAYAAGQWDAIQDQADDAPYLLYDALDDHRTRPEHAAWNGTVLPMSHKWWTTHYPPNGWNCRCSVIQLSADDLIEMGLVPSRAAPKGRTYTWENPATGKRQRIPVGVDPGWQSNHGLSHARALEETVDQKLRTYPPDFARRAAAGFRKALAAAKSAGVIPANTAAARAAGNLARTTTRNAERAAETMLAQAIEADGLLAEAIRSIRRTKAGKAMSAAELLDAAAERVRAAMRADLDGF